MGKWGKRAVTALGIVAVAAGCALVAGTQLADVRMQRIVDVRVQPVALRSDAQAIERGAYLYRSRGCADCHGAGGAGRVFIDDGALLVKGPNISPGPGNVVAGYQPVDWVRAIRHGVKPDGRPLLIMPSEDYNRWTDDDLASVVAYVRSLPRATGTAAELRLPLPVRLAYGYGVLKDAAAKIDHQLAPQRPVAEGVTVQHGAYVANMCLGCHGPQLAGGRIPGGPPDWPAAPSLRPGAGSAMPHYPTAEALLAMFRDGKRKDGTAIQVMPFEALREISDTDVRALHLYLQSLPGQPA